MLLWQGAVNTVSSNRQRQRNSTRLAGEMIKDSCDSSRHLSFCLRDALERFLLPKIHIASSYPDFSEATNLGGELSCDCRISASRLHPLLLWQSHRRTCSLSLHLSHEFVWQKNSSPGYLHYWHVFISRHRWHDKTRKFFTRSKQDLEPILGDLLITEMHLTQEDFLCKPKA